MTSKVVYFTIGDVQEQAEFASDTPAEDVKGLIISLWVFKPLLNIAASLG